MASLPPEATSIEIETQSISQKTGKTERDQVGVNLLDRVSK